MQVRRWTKRNDRQSRWPWALIYLLLSLAANSSTGAGEAAVLVLLANGNVLQGQVQSFGDKVILLRDNGSQLRLQRDQVAFTAASIDELYQYRVSQRSFDNAAVHIDDARWCLRNGLLQAAEQELQRLAAIDPTHPENQRLRRQLESAKTPHAAISIAPPPAQLAQDSIPSAATGSEPPAELPAEITPLVLATFTARVQPLLVSRCGNTGCHREPSANKWQLTHSGVSVRVAKQVTHINLANTLPYIDLGDPLASELLRYAVTPHGENHELPSARGNQAAITGLQNWLAQLGRYPQPMIGGQVAETNAAATFPFGGQGSAMTLNREVSTAGFNEPLVPAGFALDHDGELIYDPDGSFAAPLTFPPPNRHAGQESRPKRLPAVENPFSPEAFQRQYQSIDGLPIAPRK